MKTTTSTRGTQHKLGDEVESLSYGRRYKVVDVIDKNTLIVQGIDRPEDIRKISRLKVSGVGYLPSELK